MRSSALIRTSPQPSTTYAARRRISRRIVTLRDGSQIDFELAEWLYGEQMGIAKRRERLVEAIEMALGEQGENNSEYIQTVMLTPRSDHPRFDSLDMTSFKREVGALIEETERRWPHERFWHSPHGHHVGEFAAYPTIGKYVSRVVFEPLSVGQWWHEKSEAAMPWICCESPGGPYTPDTALKALEAILQSKIQAYGGLSRPARLLVYYGRAVAYNTPWFGVKFRKFDDVAAAAAKAIAGQSLFERIYLLRALEPAIAAYEIFPGFV